MTESTCDIWAQVLSPGEKTNYILEMRQGGIQGDFS